MGDYPLIEQILDAANSITGSVVINQPASILAARARLAALADYAQTAERLAVATDALDRAADAYHESPIDGDADARLAYDEASMEYELALAAWREVYDG